MRDSVIGVSEDHKVGLALEKYNAQIKSVSYEVRSLDMSRLIEGGDDLQAEDDGKYLHISLTLKDLLTQGEEYLLVLKVQTEDQDLVRFYSILTYLGTNHVQDCVDFAQRFHEMTLTGDSDGVLNYLEQDGSMDGKNLGYINIHSRSGPVTWGDMQVEQIGDPSLRFTELESDITALTMEYQVTNTETSEQYQVREAYRLRYTSTRIYLLAYERWTDKILEPGRQLVEDGKLAFGIQSSEPVYMKNTEENVVGFVEQGQLWSYDYGQNRLSLVYGFTDGQDGRADWKEHDFRLLKVDDTGSMDFLLYGYMNRGNHEGEVGAAVYYYRAERNVATEEIFVPADISYEMLKKQLDRLSYVNKQREMYLYLNENLCKVDIETGTTTVVRESIPEDCFVVSESQESIAWMDADNASSAMNITVMNLESGETQRFAADDGQKIRALGFINEDFVYGMANDSDILKDISGNEVFAMHTVRIVSIDGTVKKEYHQDGYYVTGVSISDGLLELDRVVRQENGYADAPEDHIMNGEQQSQELVTGRLATVDDRREQQFLLEFSTSGKTQSLLTLTPKYIYSTLRTDLTMSYDTGSADLYYVYGKGKLIAILSSPAEAVQLADENVGVVLNSSQSYVWERGNRQQGMRLDETTMPSGFQSASLDENVLKESLGDDYELLNLTGCTREEILYMISSGYGVVVKTGANESLLLTGYDIFGNSWLYNPATGETTALSDDDSDALFAQNGNVFISYIKKVKIE